MYRISIELSLGKTKREEKTQQHTKQWRQGGKSSPQLPSVTAKALPPTQGHFQGATCHRWLGRGQVPTFTRNLSERKTGDGQKVVERKT